MSSLPVAGITIYDSIGGSLKLPGGLRHCAAIPFHKE